MDVIRIEKPGVDLAIYFLLALIIYLSIILWIPVNTFWACIEKVDYEKVNQKEFGQKISGSLGTVSTLVAFSIAFVILIMGTVVTSNKPLSQIELTIVKWVMVLLTAGVIFFIVTLEVYDSSLNPAFGAAQIKKLYTKGWWLYTLGIYSIVIAFLLYLSLLSPWITIGGVILFIVVFSFYLKTPCEIEEKYKKVN